MFTRACKTASYPETDEISAQLPPTYVSKIHFNIILLIEVVLYLSLQPIIVDLNHQRSKEEEAFVFILLSHFLLEVIHTHQPAHTLPCHRQVSARVLDQVQLLFF